MQARPLTPDDVHAYVALRREMLRDSPHAFSASEGHDKGLDAEHLRAMLAGPGYAIAGVFDEGSLVGAAAVVMSHHAKRAHRAHVWGVYATPAARGKGVGERLLREVSRIAAGWEGVTSLGLSVSVRSPAARRLYEKVGFRAWGVEPGCLRLAGELIDEVHMVADLPLR